MQKPIVRAGSDCARVHVCNYLSTPRTCTRPRRAALAGLQHLAASFGGAPEPEAAFRLYAWAGTDCALVHVCNYLSRPSGWTKPALACRAPLAQGRGGARVKSRPPRGLTPFGSQPHGKGRRARRTTPPNKGANSQALRSLAPKGSTVGSRRLQPPDSCARSRKVPKGRQICAPGRLPWATAVPSGLDCVCAPIRRLKPPATHCCPFGTAVLSPDLWGVVLRRCPRRVGGWTPGCGWGRRRAGGRFRPSRGSWQAGCERRCCGSMRG